MPTCGSAEDTNGRAVIDAQIERDEAMLRRFERDHPELILPEETFH